jgi:hypothetical protein
MYGANPQDRGKERLSGLMDRIMLVFLCIWKHRNNVVFNNGRPGVRKVIQIVRLEFEAWKTAGLSRGEDLGFPLPPPLELLVRE